MMDSTETQLIRTQITMMTALIGAIIALTGAIIITAFGGAAPGIFLLAGLAVSLLFVYHTQLRDGWARGLLEAAVGEPDAPYFDELAEEVTADA